ncbi:MAG: HupE/UreJ family protein [Spirosomataceae bacterium]
MRITRTPFGEIELPIMVEINVHTTAPQPPMGGLFLLYYCLRLVLSVVVAAWGCGSMAVAHPMPNSMVVMNLHEKQISGEIQLPLNELQSAIGMGVNDHSEQLVERLGDSLRWYLSQHIRPRTFDGKPWMVTLGKMRVVHSTSEISGDYNELVVEFTIAPPQHYDLRNFYFDYDVIVHQAITHKILISIKQDWQQGLVSEDSTLQQVGVIELDVPTGTIKPFQISLQQGSAWKGFKNMVALGVSHIVEGTDHILFLLTLLLPAMLLVENKRWGNTLAIKPSLLHLLRIVTAFTVGHSLTLLLGTVQWLHFPSKPIEVFIAITILVSAFHAFRPVYPKREVLIAGAFGLVHGLAFAETLTNLQLSTSQLALSILGFNVGIELMQLFIIVLIFPILLVLSRTRFYPYIRQVGAVVMMILATAWMIERIQDEPNFITAWLA